MFKYIRFFLILLFFTIFSIFIYKYRRFISSPQSVVENIIPAPTIIQKNGLPNRHLIKTTFVPQAPEKNWSQPWQDACEESALLTVYYYNESISPKTDTIVNDLNLLFKFESEQGWGHDVNISQMATISAKLWKYQSKIIENPTIDDIKTYLAQDTPIIISANGKTLYKENKHFKSGGPWYHNLVILGYDDNKSQFTVHDVGTQFGANFHYSYSTLMSSIHDFPPSLKKEDIDSGVPRALILVK
ncbi:MAG: C39 family peptidase [Candidatus Shapirobacteria bacterium]